MDPETRGELAAVKLPYAPRGVSGRIRVPSSKSLTQRALVAAAMAGAGSRVGSPLDAEDPRLLFRALVDAGFRMEWGDAAVTARGRERVRSAHLFLGNNGTGARFMLAQLAALPGEWLVDGVARLRERPVAGLVRALTAMGGFFEPATAISPRGEPLREPGRLPLRIYGRELAGGDVDLDPSASSQFVSALLLLGARLPSGLRVRLAGPPPSRPYIDMTADVLRTFGAHCTADADGHAFAVDGGSLRPAEIEVEGDWSAAAFPFAAVAVAGGEVEVEGLSLASRQGDTAVASLLAAAGCSVRATSRGVAVAGPARGRLEADLRDTPDLFPALAVVVARGGGRLGGLEGLAAKESDRPAVMAAHLAGLGFSVRLTGGALVSEGRRATIAAAGAPLDPADDHRIAMALAVAGTLVEGVQVAKPACVAKSWPSFWQDWQNLVVGAG